MDSTRAPPRTLLHTGPRPTSHRTGTDGGKSRERLMHETPWGGGAAEKVRLTITGFSFLESCQMACVGALWSVAALCPQKDSLQGVVELSMAGASLSPFRTSWPQKDTSTPPFQGGVIKQDPENAHKNKIQSWEGRLERETVPSVVPRKGGEPERAPPAGEKWRQVWGGKHEMEQTNAGVLLFGAIPCCLKMANAHMAEGGMNCGEMMVEL